MEWTSTFMLNSSDSVHVAHMYGYSVESNILFAYIHPVLNPTARTFFPDGFLHFY